MKKTIKIFKEKIINNKALAIVSSLCALTCIGFLNASGELGVSNQEVAKLTKLNKALTQENKNAKTNIEDLKNEIDAVQKNYDTIEAKLIQYEGKFGSLEGENLAQEQINENINKEEVIQESTLLIPTYDDIASNPSSYKGKSITLQGTIEQTYEKGYDLVIRLQIGDNINNILIANIDIDMANGFKVGDKVEIKGICLGNQNYNSLSGARSVPHMFLKSVTII